MGEIPEGVEPEDPEDVEARRWAYRFLMEHSIAEAFRSGRPVDVQTGEWVDLPYARAVVVPDVIVIERYANGVGDPGPMCRTDEDGRTIWLYIEGVPA